MIKSLAPYVYALYNNIVCDIHETVYIFGESTAAVPLHSRERDLKDNSSSILLL